MASERDWTMLSNDLLGMIAERLPIVEFVRFRTVCTSWNSAVALPVIGGRRSKRPQSTWLMIPGDDGEFSDNCIFFSPSNNESYKITTLPELRGKWWVGSIEGWVATLDEFSEVSLFNPLTKHQIHLPSIRTFPHLRFEGDHIVVDDERPRPLHIFRQYFIQKVVWSFDLTNHTAATSSTCAPHNNFTAMVIFGNQDLAYAKAGCSTWTILDTWGDHIEDVIYHKGKFYSLSGHSEIRAWDLSGTYPKMTIISRKVGHHSDTHFTKYLVESSGDLLQVYRNYRWYKVNDSDKDHHYATSEVRVFKLDPSVAKWIPVSSLGDRYLLLGTNCSISLSTKDIPGLIQNCIYFTDDNYCGFFERHDRVRDMVVFNLEDGSFKSYYPHDFQKNWPAPIWFMPNLY